MKKLSVNEFIAQIPCGEFHKLLEKLKARKMLELQKRLEKLELTLKPSNGQNLQTYGFDLAVESSSPFYLPDLPHVNRDLNLLFDLSENSVKVNSIYSGKQTNELIEKLTKRFRQEFDELLSEGFFTVGGFLSSISSTIDIGEGKFVVVESDDQAWIFNVK